MPSSIGHTKIILSDVAFHFAAALNLAMQEVT